MFVSTVRRNQTLSFCMFDLSDHLILWDLNTGYIKGRIKINQKDSLTSSSLNDGCQLLNMPTGVRTGIGKLHVLKIKMSYFSLSDTVPFLILSKCTTYLLIGNMVSLFIIQYKRNFIQIHYTIKAYY